MESYQVRLGSINIVPIAKVIAFALSNDAIWLNGTDVVVDGGGALFHFNLFDVDAGDAANAFFGA